MDWIYGQIVGFLGNFFALMGNMGVELFELEWVSAIILFFSRLAWALFAVSVVVCAFECGIEYSTGRGNLQQCGMNIIKGFLAVSLFTVVPVRLYALSVSLQATFSAGLTGYGRSIGEVGQDIITEFNEIQTLTDVVNSSHFGLGIITSPIMLLFCVILMGYAVLKVFFANLKRGGILLIQIAVGSLYMFGVPRGYLDGFMGWTRQVIGLCLTAFLQSTILVAGLMVFKDHALMGESLRVIFLDTFVAVLAGIVIFPACFTYGLEVTAGPSLLFDTMAGVFGNMAGGRWWGALFFLFMVFAALSTVLGVCENILAMVRELTGWSRPKGCVVCGVGIFLLALTTALGYSVLHFQPFAPGSAWLDFWDFIVSNNVLPLGSLVLALFCCNRFGWGWDNFVAEANTGRGLKVRPWMKPIFKYFVPGAILFIYIYGMVTFHWR